MKNREQIKGTQNILKRGGKNMPFRIYQRENSFLRQLAKDFGVTLPEKFL